MLISGDAEGAPDGWQQVTFDANGGYGAPEPMDVSYNSSVIIFFNMRPAPDDIPSRTGYIFLGWAVTADATEPLFLPGCDEVINAGPDFKWTFYAVWASDYQDLEFLSNPSEGMVTYAGV